jgi:hypothetical protein
VDPPQATDAIPHINFNGASLLAAIGVSSVHATLCASKLARFGDPDSPRNAGAQERGFVSHGADAQRPSFP